MKYFALVAAIAGIAVAQPAPNNPFAAQGQPLCAVSIFFDFIPLPCRWLA